MCLYSCSGESAATMETDVFKMDDYNDIKGLLEPYPPLYAKDFPLILFWVPKSGSTTLHRWFLFQNGSPEDVCLMSDEEVHHYRNTMYTEKPGYTKELAEHLLKQKKDAYKLVRNPFRRAVSLFLTAVSAGDILDGMSFKQFLYRLQKAGALDRHLAPQYINGEEEVVEHYIYLEDFKAHIREIENKYRLIKAPLSKLSKSPHHFSNFMVKKEKSADAAVTKTTFDWVIPTYESFYDKEATQLVADIFKKDFEVYGFDPNHVT